MVKPVNKHAVLTDIALKLWGPNGFSAFTLWSVNDILTDLGLDKKCERMCLLVW